MNKPRVSLDSRYFETLYSRKPDPWDFRTSQYECRKYTATLAALSHPRYGSALEIGCSIGVFTRRLASRCETLLALDTSSQALASARQECRDLENVTFRQATVPKDFPRLDCDLIVLSELLYYLSVEDLVALAGHCVDALRPEGEIVLCHWLGETDYPLSGDEAAALFIEATARRLPVRRQLRQPAYRLDVLMPAEPPSGPAAAW